jgi:hypothetical protein
MTEAFHNQRGLHRLLQIFFVFLEGRYSDEYAEYKEYIQIFKSKHSHTNCAVLETVQHRSSARGKPKMFELKD